MRGDLIEPIPVLVSLGYGFFPFRCEYPLQRRLGGSPLRPRDFLQPLFSGGMFLDECLATQVDCPFNSSQGRLANPSLTNSRYCFCACERFRANCCRIQSMLKNGGTEASPAVAR